MKKHNNFGFTVVEIIVVIVVIAAIAGIGFIAYNRNIGTGKNTKGQSGTNQSRVSETDNMRVLDLKGGYSIQLTENLKAVPERKTTPYTFSATSAIECSEKTTLIAKDEEYTNPDQFHITIDVCSRDLDRNVRTWFIEDINDATDLEGLKETLTLNKNEAFKYTTPDDKDVLYAVVSGNSGIIISGRFFAGDNYSFKNKRNYNPFKVDMEKLAYSLSTPITDMPLN